VFRVQNEFKKLFEWLDDNKAQGAFIMMGIYTLATVLFVPGSLLTLAAGFIFRPLPFAVGVVLVGATCGMLLAFLLGRYVFRALVASSIARYPKFQAIDAAIAERSQGWKLVLLLRLAPVVPFNAINYLLSVTQIRFAHYCWASIVGIIPGTALFCYFGSLAGDIKDISSNSAGPGSTATIIIAVVSGVIIIITVVFVTILAKRAIARALADPRIAAQQGDAAAIVDHDTGDAKAAAAAAAAAAEDGGGGGDKQSPAPIVPSSGGDNNTTAIAATGGSVSPIAAYGALDTGTAQP
jgi:uncharacterized membrane protein YdjX (TVP38/TMEM64 family)